MVAHDWNIVALSVVIAMAASYAALDISRRIETARGGRRVFWVLASGLVLGGGIWSMHFVAMLAMIVDVPVSYRLDLTALSLALALALTALGFHIVSRREATAAVRILMAGGIIGLGVSAMHYTGMAGMEIAAHISYDPLLVAASVAIGLVAATVAMYLTVNPPMGFWQPAAAVVMGIAISGLHYTGMAALRIETSDPLYLLSRDEGMLQSSGLALGVAAVTALLLVVSLMAAGLDRHLLSKMRRDQNALSASNDQLRRLIETSGAVPWEMSGDDFSYTYVGPQAESLLGYPAEDWLTPGFWIEHVHPDDLPRVHEETLELLAGGKQRDLEYRMVAADGREVWLRDIVNLGREGEDVLLRGFLFDITEGKERERILDAARQEAERASAAKSAFLATMSHELRTPLNAIIGFSELLKEESFGPHSSPRYKEYATDINESAQHLLSIISDILTLARLNAATMEVNESRVELWELAGSVARMLRPIAERGQVRLDMALAEQMISLRGDERSLKQLLVNLVSNAVKFTGPGGEVRVHALPRQDQEPLCIVVEDTGIGIPEDKLDHVMEPFQQVESSLARSFQGIGLGLPLARGFAQLHGGDLTLDSQPDAGTRVILTLPAERLVGRPVLAVSNTSSAIEPLSSTG